MSSTFDCPSCSKPQRPDARFCANCGANLAGGPLLSGNRWARSPQDFATRVEVDDVQGFFKKGLIVEEGTRALFFTDGACTGILEAGRHEMGGLVQRISNVFSSRRTTAVLVDSGDIEIKFELEGMQTSDPLRIAATSRVVLRIDESPVRFFTNLMKGQQSYPLSELRAFLEPELRDAAQEFMGGRSTNELSSNLAVKQAMEQVVSAHLSRTLERKGLQLVQIRVLDLRLAGDLEEYWLEAQELRTRLAGGAMRDNVERKVLDQETARALTQVAVFEERASVYQRLHDAVAAEEIGKRTTAADLEDALAKFDKRHVLTQDEVDVLRRDVQERNVDHALARKHLLETLQVNRQLEEERLKLVGKLSLQSTVAQAMRSEELHQFEVGLEKRRRASAVARREALDQADDDFAEAERGIGLLAKLKAVKADAADREERRQLDAERDRHTRELERYRQLAELGPDALLTFGPADRAPILAELRKTEILRGMSEGQILAMAAEKSGPVAEALKEKFRGEAGRELAERMIADKDRSNADAMRASRDHADQLERFAMRALDTMRDTAVAATRAGQPGLTLVTSGPEQAGGGNVPPRCPKCRRDVPVGQNFCDNCGHRFID